MQKYTIKFIHFFGRIIRNVKPDTEGPYIMITFLSELIKTTGEVPDRPAVVDLDGNRTTTYRELLTFAYKVNAWLRERGIGREDVCAIYFPRGVEYIAVRIGIMMAGACCVNLEDLMGRERIDFVIKDCACKAVFTKDKWEEAMSLPCCEDIADPDDKDLAFIIYTSGSTGTPFLPIWLHPMYFAWQSAP